MKIVVKFDFNKIDHLSKNKTYPCTPFSISREQHDSLEFFNALLDNLVEGTKALGQKPFIAQVLEGSFADQKICKGCPHR